MRLRLLFLILCIAVASSPAYAESINLTLEAQPASVVADGENYSKVRAFVMEGGVPVSGAVVTFIVGNSSLVVRTNSSGVATAKVGPSRTVQIIAVNASTPKSESEVLRAGTQVSFVLGRPEYLYLYADPSSVGVWNVTANISSVIRVRMVDRLGNSVPTQTVNLTIRLVKGDGSVSNPPDFTLIPSGIQDGSGNVSFVGITDSSGSIAVGLAAGNTSGSVVVSASAGALNASNVLRIMGEPYLLVEASVEPASIMPPATVNVTISVRGIGEKFLGGLPMDVMLVTDTSGSMDVDWYNIWEKVYWSGGEADLMEGLTEYKFKRAETVSGFSQWNASFYLNESVNDLWFKLNVTGLGLQVTSPSGKTYGYQGANNSPAYMYSRNYKGWFCGEWHNLSGRPDWIWLKPDSYPSSGDCGYYPTSNDSDFPEQGNWMIRVYNTEASTKNFNLTTYIEKLSAAKIAGKTFNSYLNPAYDRVGLVPFNSEINNPLPLYGLTNNISSINSRIESMFAKGSTPTAHAISRAAGELNNNTRPNALRYMILLSDGQPNVRDWSADNPVSDAVNQADKAKKAGIRIFAIGIGTNNIEPTMRAIASNDSYYYAANASQLKDIYGDIAKQITNISAKRASLNITLSGGMNYSANASYVNGSSRQAYKTQNSTFIYSCSALACEPSTTNPLHWEIQTPNPPDNRTIKVGEQWVLSFQLNLSGAGLLFDMEKSLVDYLNYLEGNRSINLPDGRVSQNATALKPSGLLVSQINLSKSRDTVKAKGRAKVDLLARVYDEEGNPVPDGTEAIFYTTLGTFIQDSEAEVTSLVTEGGSATAPLYSIGIAGNAYIYSESKAEYQPTYVASNTVTVQFVIKRIIIIS